MSRRPRSEGFVVGSINALMVLERSEAEIPVVQPFPEQINRHGKWCFVRGSICCHHHVQRQLFCSVVL